MVENSTADAARLAERMKDFVRRLAERFDIDVDQLTHSREFFMRVLLPTEGSLCVRSQIRDVLTVYHYPAAVTLGIAAVYCKPEDFIDREMDFLIRENDWEPIDYWSETMHTKDPLQIAIYADTWAEELERQGWLTRGTLVASELL